MSAIASSGKLPVWATAVWWCSVVRDGQPNSGGTSVTHLQSDFLYGELRVAPPDTRRPSGDLNDYGLSDLDDMAAHTAGSAGGSRFNGSQHAGRYVIGKLLPGQVTHFPAISFRDLCADFTKGLEATPSEETRAFTFVAGPPDKRGHLRLRHEQVGAHGGYGGDVDSTEGDYCFHYWTSGLALDKRPVGMSLAWPPTPTAPARVITMVDDWFFYARDRPVRGPLPHSGHNGAHHQGEGAGGKHEGGGQHEGHARGSCDIRDVAPHPHLTLEQKRAYFDLELSTGYVRGPGGGIFQVVHSTLPYRVGKHVDTTLLCADFASAVSYTGAPNTTAAEVWSKLCAHAPPSAPPPPSPSPPSPRPKLPAFLFAPHSSHGGHHHADHSGEQR